MKWYKKLYLTENTKASKMRIMEYTVLKKFQPDVYLIVLSDNANNYLEMIKAISLKQPHYNKKEVWDKLYVVGIAKGYDEGIELMARIISEMYKNTGGFNIREYLGFGN